MKTIAYLALTLALMLCSAGWSSTQAQMPALDVAIDADQMRIAASPGQEIQVEVYAPSGEMIFASGALTDQAVEWKMQDQKGERVADGVYLVTIQLKTASGQVRKRIEQVVVGQKRRPAAQQSPSALDATITGTGTTGRIAKFTNTTVIGNSVMTESSGKIGIGITAPTAFFHVKEGGSDTAVAGVSTGSGIGVHGISTDGDGVRGKSTSANGVYGIGNTGVYGVSTETAGNGVLGEANNGASAYGVWGRTKTGIGVFGSSSSSGTGVYGSSTSGRGVQGVGSTYGVYGSGDTGVYGTGNTGVYGKGDPGVYGNGGVMGVANVNQGTFAAVYGKAITPGDLPLAGYFEGNVQVNGNLTKNGGSFKIDDPLDPANKYLYHSFVESPDMMDIYDGNVTTDANGEATVTLPRYFQALNRDFRYQLTVIGEFAQAIIASEIKGNRFQIKTDKPGVKVSWQVTGVRRDAWAEAHRIPVEEEKPERERGFYLHPELFHQPEERGIEWALHPELMQQMKEEERGAQQQPPPSVKQ